MCLKSISSVAMSDTDPGPSNGECTSVCSIALCSNAAERVPLLDTAEEELGQSTFSDCINKVAQEPLTPLTKILLILALILLLVSSASVEFFKISSLRLTIYRFLLASLPGLSIDLVSTAVVILERLSLRL